MLRRIRPSWGCFMRSSLYSVSQVSLQSDPVDALATTRASKLDLQIACKNAIAEFAHFGDRVFRLEEPQKDTLWELHALHVQAMATRRELLKVLKAGLRSERQVLAFAMRENDKEAERKVRSNTYFFGFQRKKGNDVHNLVDQMFTILNRLNTLQQPVEQCVKFLETALASRTIKTTGPTYGTEKDEKWLCDDNETLVDDSETGSDVDTLSDTIHSTVCGSTIKIWRIEDVREFGRLWEEMEGEKTLDAREPVGIKVERPVDVGECPRLELDWLVGEKE